jgi:hypothetical protein
MYKIAIGNEYTESRPLTAAELDGALEFLRDVFDDQVFIMAITATHQPLTDPRGFSCDHTAWEEYGAGRRCADCRQYLDSPQPSEPEPDE